MARRKKIAPLSPAQPSQQFTLAEVLEILRTFNVIAEDERQPQEAELPIGSAETTPEPKQLYTVEEAARRLRIGRTTVYDLMREGKLDSVQIGRRRLVPAEAVAAYLASVRQSKPAA
jgi:excisionase family DNA binding protein